MAWAVVAMCLPRGEIAFLFSLRDGHPPRVMVGTLQEHVAVEPPIGMDQDLEPVVLARCASTSPSRQRALVSLRYFIRLK